LVVGPESGIELGRDNTKGNRPLKVGTKSVMHKPGLKYSRKEDSKKEGLGALQEEFKSRRHANSWLSSGEKWGSQSIRFRFLLALNGKRALKGRGDHLSQHRFEGVEASLMLCGKAVESKLI